jgi:hypothetical protein
MSVYGIAPIPILWNPEAVGLAIYSQHVAKQQPAPYKIQQLDFPNALSPFRFACPPKVLHAF